MFTVCLERASSALTGELQALVWDYVSYSSHAAFYTSLSAFLSSVISLSCLGDSNL